MKNNSHIELKNNFLLVHGELDFTTVNDLWENSLPLLAREKNLNFDFSQVGKSNSAGVALIIEWIKYAKKENKNISFVNIPAQLESIIKVTGVDKMLNLA